MRSTSIITLVGATIYGLVSYSPNEKMGIALVGLDNYSTNNLPPALLECEHVTLKGIVTGSPEKIPIWKKKYNLEDKNIYSYENFDQIAKNPEIDIVYIVLPNFMHAEYTIRAARAGKHVICEKPMAINPQECESMIKACEKAKVRLQIGYRLHYEVYNSRAREVGQNQIYGPVNSITAGLAFNALNFDNWRFYKEKAGGGPMMDVGIYCLQGSRYVTGEEPVKFTAQQAKRFPNKFKDIEETLYWQTEFPSGASANCSTSYAAGYDYMMVSMSKGRMELNPAFGYTVLGNENRKPMTVNPVPFPQTTQMDGMALAIKNNKSMSASGEEGLKDMRCIAAIYKAMETGKEVYLEE